MADFSNPAGSPGRLGNPVLDRPPPGRNMPLSAWVRQGGKLGVRGRLRPLRLSPLVEYPRAPRIGDGKQSLTLFCSAAGLSSKIWACDRCFGVLAATVD